MKRGADFGGGGGGRFNNGDGPKRFRNGPPMQSDPSKLEARVLIPTRVAGRIIGKGGENVKRLRTDYKASVSIPDSTAPERIVYISSDEVDNIAEVARDVLMKMEESRNKDAPEEKNIEMKVLVHKGQAGAIIGKGGAKIKEIREQTKTNVKVFPETCPQSTDRVCVIAGAQQAMLDAMKEVIKCYMETPIKGPSIQYDTNNYDAMNLPGYGGYPPDRNWRGPQQPMGGMGPGGMPTGGPGGYGPPGMGMGGGGPQGYGGGYMGNGASMGMPGGGGMGAMGMNYGGMQMPGNGPQQDMGGQNAGQQTSQVTIPKEMAGTIIGRAGERLKSIKEQSGAYVVVEPLEQGANDRIISITGTPQSIQMAQYLLQQTVRTSQFGRQFQ